MDDSEHVEFDRELPQAHQAVKKSGTAKQA